MTKSRHKDADTGADTVADTDADTGADTGTVAGTVAGTVTATAEAEAVHGLACPQLEIDDGVHDFVEVGFVEAGAAYQPVGVGAVAVAVEVTERVEVVGDSGPKNAPPNHALGGDETIVEAIVELAPDLLFDVLPDLPSGHRNRIDLRWNACAHVEGGKERC